MGQIIGNCIIAQSGGPTSVINATAYGCIKEFLSTDNSYIVYAGIYGIEGILQKKIMNVSKIPVNEIEKLRYMPSAAFGSNRYRLKDYKIDNKEYIKLFDVFKDLNIRYFFYIGGNDSMDTANKIFNYASSIGYELYVCGIPKTIDNDLVLTDHCPGFGSAAKFVATAGIEMWLDINAYKKISVMVMEVMGRDTGWIAASSCVLKNAVSDMNLLIYLPEKAFDKQNFLSDVSNALEKKDKLLIVASEGLKDSNGKYIDVSENCYQEDNYGHQQLGGIGKSLRQSIRNNITSEVKFAELGILQRCSMHCASETDIMEAEMVGRHSVRYALGGYTGFMTAIVRTKSDVYECATKMIKLADVCNKIRYVPSEWLSGCGEGINQQMLGYMEPLIFDVGKPYCFFGMDGRINPISFRRYAYSN